MRDGRTDKPNEPVVLADLEDLVPEWLTLEQVAATLDLATSQVRRLLQDRHLIAVRRGRPARPHVPAALVVPEPLPGLAGTVTVLLDAGFSDAEAVRWLFTEQEGLAGSPVTQLRAGHKTEIRRRAQVLAF